ncbi:NADPH:quinone reductase [Paralimibaculum aggregatum]|uniref:NADPH:quinone reductase n=1 Tax=Paralimibaculum aggregatum TaxID=3036245 RepID=A0ABQ6LF45_9RHOB|nr:NADPH:quinone reductase [Limibaculum sp. NKW23]GMG81948.1 NADPH:quinone reductase [Limibaculum sp. NKW23]
MKAIAYERFGPADEVLTLRDIEDPAPAPGEVVVRLEASGVNPSDVKLRAGARPGAQMAYPLTVPHSDGAGVIEAVGEGIDPSRIGQRVWLWNGHWRREFGTAAERIALPAVQTSPLPGRSTAAEGACLGIPAMTAWMTLFEAGSIAGARVLVTGGAGAVGRYAVQMARLGGAAQVITTVSGPEKAAHASAHSLAPDAVIDYRREDVTARVMELTGGAGVDRVVDVDLGANMATTAAVIAENGTIATYASMAVPEPALPFYQLMFKNVTLRMVLAYLMAPEARARAAAGITDWLAEGRLSHAVGPQFPLAETAAAHRAVEAGGVLGTVVVTV